MSMSADIYNPSTQDRGAGGTISSHAWLCSKLPPYPRLHETLSLTVSEAVEGEDRGDFPQACITFLLSSFYSYSPDT